jgi:hypothetical protein
MRSKICFLFIVVLLFHTSSFAQSENFGLGAIIGKPTGISGKYWLNNENAIDVALGYSFENNSSINIHADYLWHIYNVFDTQITLPLYYGVGGKFNAKDGNKSSLGVRGVIGLVWWPERAPLDVFFELAPVFNLIPETELDIDAAIGVRYFFNR